MEGGGTAGFRGAVPVRALPGAGAVAQEITTRRQPRYLGWASPG